MFKWCCLRQQLCWLAELAWDLRRQQRSVFKEVEHCKPSRGSLKELHLLTPFENTTQWKQHYKLLVWASLGIQRPLSLPISETAGTKNQSKRLNETAAMQPNVCSYGNSRIINFAGAWNITAHTAKQFVFKGILRNMRPLPWKLAQNLENKIMRVTFCVNQRGFHFHALS